MAFTRKMLKALGIEDEKVDQIMEAHSEVVDGIKAERDELRDSAKDFADIQKKLNDANEEIKTLRNGNKEYDKLKSEYDAYKSSVENERTATTKKELVTTALKEAGIMDKYIDTVLKVTDLRTINLDENGNFVDKKKFVEDTKANWADFIGTTATVGAKVTTPPASNNSGTMTKDEIMNIKDPVARQNAIAENLKLFGKG